MRLARSILSSFGVLGASASLLVASCRAGDLGPGDCVLVCEGDGHVWNTCDASAAFRECDEWEVCVEGSAALAGQAWCEEYIAPETAAYLEITSMPAQPIRAVFPRFRYTRPELPLDGCLSFFEPVPESGRPVTLPSVTIADVQIANPDTGDRIRLPLGTIDDRSPFYFAIMDPSWDPDEHAGARLEWRITGAGDVPSFVAPFTLPEPIHEFTPFPRGDGVVDFARADGWRVTWDPGSVTGDRVGITIVGRDLEYRAEGAGRRILCYPRDDGEFTVPATELLRLDIGSATVGIRRFQHTFLEVPGLSGNGQVVSVHHFVPVHPVTGTGIPLVYEID